MQLNVMIHAVESRLSQKTKKQIAFFILSNITAPTPIIIVEKTKWGNKNLNRSVG